jgi:hypothetical protein
MLRWETRKLRLLIDENLFGLFLGHFTPSR